MRRATVRSSRDGRKGVRVVFVLEGGRGSRTVTLNRRFCPPDLCRGERINVYVGGSGSEADVSRIERA